MVIIYHLANPDIVNIILIVDFTILIFAGFLLRKKIESVKKSWLFILSGFLAAVWYFIFFFIPAIMFTSLPSAEEIQFLEIYSLIWHKLVPGIILIVSLGVSNIIIGLYNKKNYGNYLIVSGGLSIISILLNSFDFFPLVINTIASIIMAISVVVYLYFAIKIKAIYLCIFCIIFIFSIVFPLIMPDHYIKIF
ncbi:MAG: hypothetical protein ACFFFB_05140 [Candidatus Heimdallarchaeota archaeon]